MELLKDFKPTLSEDGDEFYPNGIFVFNISKLIQHIANNQSAFQVEKVEVNLIPTYSTTTLNEETVMLADLTIPIIMAEISPDQYNVIDGHHRLEKARRQNVTNIPTYKIPAEQHIHFLTSVDSYQKYIEYWNIKVKERE